MSVIRTGGDALRVAFNRDELLTRGRAVPPRSPFTLTLSPNTGRPEHALMPIDPQSDGTWIAVNDAGLVLAVLNVNERGSKKVGSVSRGRIIPSLLDQANPTDAIRTATTRLPFSDLAPFRLIALNCHRYGVLLFDGTVVSVAVERTNLPMMFTSSGLGDALVEGPRRELFEELVVPDPTPQSQDAFHCHTWPDRPHLSVRMSREDARTVSCTTIEIDDRSARMDYHEVVDEVVMS